MTEFQNRAVNFLTSVEFVQTMAWTISNFFDLTGSGFHPSILYVYQESSYSREYIKQTKMTCFHLYCHYSISV
jgi:hypothetical protein